MKSEHTRFICSLKHQMLGYVLCIKITIIFFLSLGLKRTGCKAGYLLKSSDKLKKYLVTYLVRSTPLHLHWNI